MPADVVRAFLVGLHYDLVKTVECGVRYQSSLGSLRFLEENTMSVW